MNKVNFVEVGPRDGFQSINEFIPTNLKIKIIEGIIAAGVKKIQVTSFVSPKAIPQMKDAKEVVAALLKKYQTKDVEFFALVPNFHGAKAAFQAGLREVSTVISVSESHNKANINKTVDEAFGEVRRILDELPELKVSIDVATAFTCPFEGYIPIESLLSYIKKGVEIGINNFTLCDTVGGATPKMVSEVITAVYEYFPEISLGIHIHDTRNMGTACTLAAVESGVDTVQAALAGLGGCPFAPGASGNVSSEDLIYMFIEMGIETGIDFKKILEIAKFEKNNIKGNYSGHHIYIGNGDCNK